MARPRKHSTEELLSIINKYFVETPYITKLSYADLAKYSNKLGYKDITYQDFSRNETIKEFINEYKKQKKLSLYSKLNQNKLEKIDFNVESIVEKNIKNKNQLKAILKIYKESYDKAFDKIIEDNNLLKEFKEKIAEQDKAIKKFKAQNSKLRDKINDLIEYSRDNKYIETQKFMYSFLKYLVDNHSIPLKNEDDLTNILKNLGYNNESDIVDKEMIFNECYNELQNSIIEEKDFEFENIINLKEKPKKNIKKLNIPDFMK